MLFQLLAHANGLIAGEMMSLPVMFWIDRIVFVLTAIILCFSSNFPCSQVAILGTFFMLEILTTSSASTQARNVDTLTITIPWECVLSFLLDIGRDHV